MWLIQVKKACHQFIIYIPVSHNDQPQEMRFQNNQLSQTDLHNPTKILHGYQPSANGPHAGAGIIKWSIIPFLSLSKVPRRSTELKTTHWSCQARALSTGGDGVVELPGEWRPTSVLTRLPCSLVLCLVLSDVCFKRDVQSPGEGRCAADVGTDWCGETRVHIPGFLNY